MIDLPPTLLAKSIRFGEAHLWRANDALAVLDELQAEGAQFLGLDGFRLRADGKREASLDLVLDVSKEPSSLSPKRYQAGRDFIERNAAPDVAFELVWD